MPYFVSTRHRNRVKNKKKNIPTDIGYFEHDNNEWSKINLHIDKFDGKSLSFAESVFQKFVLRKNGRFCQIIESHPPKENICISRFLAKIGVEALVKIAVEVEGGLESIANNPGLKPIIDYFRFNRGTVYWPYSARPLYNEGCLFFDALSNSHYEVLHEYMLFQTEPNIWHLAVCIFGYEYVINLVEPEIQSYSDWMLDKNNISPLYMI